MPIREVELLEIRRTYFATEGRSARKQVVEDAAKRYGVSYSTINRQLDLGIRSESKPNPELLAKKAEINTWATQIFDFAQSNTKDEKRILIKRAFKVYQKYHGLPDHITLRNVYDAIEEMKLKNQSAHCPGHFRKGSPRELYHMDFTVSRYIKHLGNGILRITNDRYTRKNKDEEGEKVRLWIGGVLDDHSNVIYYEYVLTLGESAIAAQEVILNAFRRKDERMLQGLPQQVYLDRGPGFRDQGFRAGLEGIGVSVKFGDDILDRRTGKRTNQTNKGAHGKIERMHEVVKNDFEQELLLGILDGCDLKAGSHTTINELNRLLWKWCEEYNDQNTHPEYKGQNKWRLFADALSEQDYLPDDCASFFARTSTRVVTQRRVQIGANKWYKVPDEISEGAKIEIITIGDTHYTMVNGRRVHLPPTSGQVGEAIKMIKPDSERKTDLITDEDTIRDRFDQELKRLSGGIVTLQDLDDVLYITMCRDWLKESHTIEEIKSRADYIVIRAKEQMREAEIAESQEINRIGNDPRGHGVREGGERTAGARIIQL